MTAVEVVENLAGPHGNENDGTPRAVMAQQKMSTDVVADPALTEAPNNSTDEVLGALNDRLAQLARAMEEANRLSQDRERIIDRLHQENQSLRQGELLQALLPILKDSIRLFDDLKQTSINYASRAEVRTEDAVRDFECLTEMMSDILYRYGVERYQAREGEAFNAKEHKVLGAIPTPEPAKDRTIARMVREGFRRETGVVRLLEAEVYRYVPGDTPATTAKVPDRQPSNFSE